MGTEDQRVQVAQQRTTMFERNIGHAAARHREVRVLFKDRPDERIGFVAGLDEGYLQLCLTDTQTLSLCERDYILAVEETGRTLKELKRAGGLAHAAVERIEDRCSKFQKRMHHAFGRRDTARPQ